MLNKIYKLIGHTYNVKIIYTNFLTLRIKFSISEIITIYLVIYQAKIKYYVQLLGALVNLNYNSLDAVCPCNNILRQKLYGLIDIKCSLAYC